MKLSKRQLRAIEIAKKAALESDCYHRHGAVLINKGNAILNIATNSGDYSSFGERFNFRTDRFWHATRHAEISACLNVPEAHTRGATIYVVRVSSEGKLRNSKPCDMCCEVMKFLQIRRAIYSNADGGFSSLKIG